MRKFDILDPNLDIFQSYFIEASAGTGKTFAIEHLACRLLLESEPPIALSEILAVTFTKEAANEMKMRIRKQLLSHESEKRARLALALFDDAQIFTIHGFCHRMLTEYALEANSSMQLCSPDRPDHLTEMRRTVEDFFQTADSKFSQEVAHLIRQSRFDLEKLIDQIVHAMQEGTQPKALSLPELPAISFDQLKSDVETLAPRYKRLKWEMCQKQLPSFFSYLERPDPSILLKEKEWFFEKMHEGNVKVKAPPLHTLPLKAPEFFQLLENKLLDPFATFRDRGEMIRRLAAACLKRWRAKAERRDQLTFDDLLDKMKRALAQRAFKEKVQERYRAVIVDEFQDTDPIQWEIFQELFSETHLLYLVGDPKQSIYGFRNADIYTYMRAAKSLGSERRVHLDTNFRSSPALVDALNALFTKRSDWIDLPSLPGSLLYHPVKAGREETLLEEPPIVIFGAKGEVGRERRFPTRAIEEEQLFPYIAQEIARLRGRIPLSQIAVLISDRYHAQRLQLHFNKWNIPSTVKRSFHLAQSRGFLEIELFLQALIHPDRPGSVRAAMRGDDGDNPFYELGALSEEKGFAAAFYRYLEYHFSGDERAYAELRQTGEILMDYQGATPHELFSVLQELKRQSPESDERLQLRGSDGAERVRIMTPFASKGLEFDVVFALSVAYRKREVESAEQHAEEMRKLYVAFTRAREKLYIPYAVEMGKPAESASPIECFFQHIPPEVEWIQTPISIAPYQSEQTRQAPIQPPPPKGPFDFDREFLTSFSAMAASHGNHALIGGRFQMQDLSEKTPHTLPLGAETGTLIHAVFEAHLQTPAVSVEQVALETLSGTHLEGWEETIAKMVTDTLSLPIDENFSLRQLRRDDYFPEMEFLFPKSRELIKGFVDLVFRRGDTFYIVDWKTNWVGPDCSDYTQEALGRVMEEHDYYLQARLYAEAVMRYVKQLYTNPQFGGAYYLFVRGRGVVKMQPSEIQ